METNSLYFLAVAGRADAVDVRRFGITVEMDSLQRALGFSDEVCRLVALLPLCQPKDGVTKSDVDGESPKGIGFGSKLQSPPDASYISLAGNFNGALDMPLIGAFYD